MTQRIDPTIVQAPVTMDNFPVPADSPTAPAEIPLPDTATDDTGIAAQTEQFEKRLEHLLNRAAASGVEGLSASYSESIENSLPRPSFGKSGYLLHPKILDAAKKCDLAAKNLSTLSLKECQTTKLSDEQFKIIEDYITSQHNLYGAIQAYLDKTGKPSPLLQSLMQATQFRAAEALNLVGTLQLLAKNSTSPDSANAQPEQKLSHIDPEKSLLQGMQAFSHTMHGHTVSDQLQTAAAALFAKTDSMEKSQSSLNVAEFTQKAADLKKEVQSLKAQISAMQNPQTGLQMDTALHGALLACVSRMETRLDSMQRINPYETISSDAEQIVSHYDLSVFDHVKSKNPLIGRLLKDLQEAYTAHNQSAEQLKQEILNASLTPQQLNNKISQIVSKMWEDKTMQAIITVAYMARTQKKAAQYGLDFDKQIKGIKQNMIKILDSYGLKINDKEAGQLIDFALENLQNPSFSLLGEYCEAIAFFSNSLFAAETNELSAMYANAKSSQTKLLQSHILEALEHNVDMATLLEASMRGIPLNQLETIAGDAILVQSKVLGQGAANTVNLCTYRGKDGESMQLVFKPELNARYGLGHLTASGLGYKAETRVMQINIAACRSAQSIGCEDVIAKSSIGSFEGKFGLFMEAAKGSTFYSIQRNRKSPCGVNSKGETFSYGQSITLLTQKGLQDTMRANLMRELCKLEWADCLSGQVDRHGDNYLISIDTDTGKVTVTGIDNDASFSVRKIGMNKIHVGDDKEKLEQLRKLGPVDVTPDGIIDTSSFNNAQLKTLRSFYGFNQLFAPSHIDKETFEKLMAIDLESYKQSLAECLDSEAVNAAVLRLKDAQDHAKLLESQKKVVEDWTDPNLYSEYKEESKRENTLTMGFYARDFLRT